ncbi:MULTISPECIES: PTS sugar transporter subunit IIB [Fusobacterium]|uniref:PTS sugar transporter subunit IIB n=1 Tax=Fusobacterium TaxID=848 RepID=UPI001476EA66|nr:MULTISPECIES: PTS sugar transporter subunit IIB [Fusobacterium]NME35333.1 PTS sugar transporter subunit IIB [Fusobacterium sp. FSA-380-WT-3A]
MKITAVCGTGLGSSFMLEMNVKKVLKELGITAEVNHTDLASVIEGEADFFIMSRDIAGSANVSNKIVLANIINVAEIKEAMVKAFQEKGIL